MQPIRAEPLALFRILVALTMIGSALTSVAVDLPRFWSSDGLIPGEVTDKFLEGNNRFCVLRGFDGIPVIRKWLPADLVESSKRWMSSTAGISTAFVVWMTALVLLAAGCYSRTSAFVAWLLTVSFNHRALWAMNGGDDVGVQLLFYLILAPAGAIWSLDALRKRKKCVDTSPPLIAPWSVRLIQIQLCFIYLATAFSKMDFSVSLFENDWITGQSVYWVLNDSELSRWSYGFLPVPMLLCRLAAWGTIAFEFGFALLVWFRRLRPWVLAAGITLHLGILVTMEVGWFSQFTLCYYAVFLRTRAANGTEEHGSTGCTG
jgi:hypothetical protein